MPGWVKVSLAVSGIVVLVLVLALVIWQGPLVLFMLLGLALVLLVVVSVLASLASIVIAFLPIPKVPVSYNLRNLQVRWKTTVVTAVAFTMVVALLTAMLAFVQGMNRLTEGSGQPGNIMVLSDGATDEAFSALPPGIEVQSLPKYLQDMIVRDENGKHWAVKEVYVFATQELPEGNPSGLKRRFVQVRGFNDPLMAAKVHGIELEDGGEWFSDTGVRKLANGENAYEAVLGDGMAKIFGADRGQGPLGPGEIVTIGPKKWYVVGVMKTSGSVFGSEIWARDSYVAQNFGRQKDGGIAYNTIVVRLKDPSSAREAAAQIKKRSPEALDAMAEQDYYAKLGESNQQMLAAITVVAIFMAFGGILSVMITMFAAISLRAKDIGVLRLLGFSRWQILWSLLLESMVIAFLGGILGCALGSLANGVSMTSIVSSGGGGGGKIIVLKLVISGWIILAGLLCTLIMGAVGGLVPSLFSMRLRPLESLR